MFDVAVITAAYNAEQWIKDCVDSVRQQTYPALHVVVDDGSADYTGNVAEDYGATVYPVTNRGLAAARNAALMNLPDSIQWVVALDADDWLEPHFIEECMKVGWASDYVAVVPSIVRYSDQGEPVAVECPEHDPGIEEWWRWEQTWAYGCSMIKRSSLAYVGGYHPATGGDCDFDLWLDFKTRGWKIGYAPKARFHYRNVPTSMTHTLAHEHEANRQEIMRHNPWIGVVDARPR